MVKRIRKRVAKKDTESTDVEETLPEGEGGATGLRAELGTLGEDDFTRRIAGGFGWILDNRGLLIGASVALIIVATAVTIMGSQDRSAKAEAASSFHMAASGYADVVLPSTPAQADPANAEDPAERAKKLEKALRSFGTTSTTYPESPIAALAQLGEAGANADLGKHDEALKLYDAALNTQGIDSMSKLIALQAKATVLENKGDNAGALAAWKTVGDLDTQAFGVMAGLQRGRILEATGKKGEALTLYQAIEKDHEKALEELSAREYRSELDKRLARLTDAKK